MTQEQNYLVTSDNLEQTINRLMDVISPDEHVLTSELDSETWTFVLDDDSEVEKEVAIWTSAT